MDRVSLKKRPCDVLEMLEHRAETHCINKMGGWIPGPFMEKEIGINWKVGLNKLEHKKKPLLGLGFKIAREHMRDGSNQWRYRLVAYPINWNPGDQVDLSHIQEVKPKAKPVVKGQQPLFDVPAWRYDLTRGLVQR